MRILITGVQGMLGSDLAQRARARGHEVLAAARNDLDITDRDAVAAYILQAKIDGVINCAADNALDLIETDDMRYAHASRVNGDAPGYVAEAARAVGAWMVHVSTDYVFAGDKTEGYSEDDTPRPISRYGVTKYQGELCVQEVGGSYYLVRVSKIFGNPGVSIGAKEDVVSLMLRLAASKSELCVVDEEVGCPTYVPHAAEAMLRLVEERYAYGVYHLVNRGPGVTVYGFTREIFDAAHVTTPLIPVLRSTFPRPTPCPKFAALLNTKFPPLPSRTEALREFLTKRTSV